jgi:hypothetical protein
MEVIVVKFECLDCHKLFVYPAVSSVAKSNVETVEFHVCPYCFSKNIEEISLSRHVESVQSVKINEADALLKQGYEVKDTYASTVTLVKYAVTEKPKVEERPTLPERQESIEKEAAQLRKDLKNLTEA